MKKIVFLFLYFLFFFSSCGSKNSSDEIKDPENYDEIQERIKKIEKDIKKLEEFHKDDQEVYDRVIEFNNNITSANKNYLDTESKKNLDEE